MKISNLMPLVILGILIAYSLDDSPPGSRKLGGIGRWFKKAGKKVGRALGTVGHAVGAAVKGAYMNSPFKMAYDAIRDPKKFANKFVQGVKDVGGDIRNYGEQMGKAGNSLIHGDLRGVYDHWESAVNPIARRGLDFVSGGSASAFEDTAGVDLMDFMGQGERFGRGIGQAVSDFSKGDVRAGLGDVFDTASPYIQAAEDAETGGFAHTVNETMGEGVTTNPFDTYDAAGRLYHGDQDTWDNVGDLVGQYAADRAMGQFNESRAARVDGLAKYDRR